MHINFSSRTSQTTESPINWLIQYALENPDTISLAAGLVDYDSLPFSALNQIVQDLMSDENKAKKILQYGSTIGLPSLRQKVIENFNKQENTTTPFHIDQCIITTGSQQLLFLLCDTILNPGDVVILEAPTYFVFMDTLKTFGVECYTVQIDHHGIIPEKLEGTLDQIKRDGKLQKTKFLYTVDYHQNPTGYTLAENRKPVILDLIQKYSTESPILILEDAAYRDLGFSESSPKSFKALDPMNEWVLYTSTFSKPFCPGIKVGYGIIPDEILKYVVRHKGNHDFGTANLNQFIVDKAIEDNHYTTQYMKLKKVYREKSVIMKKALKRNLSHMFDFYEPEGGFYYWLKSKTDMSTGRDSEYFQCCLDNKVMYVPGEYCYYNSNNKEALGVREIRLSFGTATQEQIEEGILRMKNALP